MNCEICGTELIPDECSQPICYDCYNSEAYADWEWKQTHKNMNTDGIARIAAELNRQIKDHGLVKYPYWAQIMYAEIQREIDKCILGSEFVTEEKK